MNKYRTVKFENGMYGIQKRHFGCIWSLTGDQDCDSQGHMYGWQPNEFESKEEADHTINDWLNSHKIVKTF
jgi:hypothetical protein